MFEDYTRAPRARTREGRNVKVEQLIDCDEQGMKIVNVLPDSENSSRMYLHLGMYYQCAAGEALGQYPDGRPVLDESGRQKPADPAAAQKWNEKAVWVLERGSAVDRAFSEVSRKRELDRKKYASGDLVPDAGLAPLYLYLGQAYQKIGRIDEARQAFRYMRQLDPSEPTPYIQLAQLESQQGHADRSAVLLICAVLVDREQTQQNTWQMLAGVYNSIAPGEPCVLVDQQGRSRLNIEHARVRTDVSDAFREIIRALRAARREDGALSWSAAAQQMYRVPQVVLQPVFDEPHPPVVPPPPIFYKPPATQPKLPWD
jgi:tetratricopeptide (TPR) repeat protein